MTDDSTRDDLETMRYDLWVEEALRTVIKKTLAHVAEHGLPGDHHFYISFYTQDDGVQIPGRLRAQHPNDMTIVLQYQFENLVAGEDAFEVTLSFGGSKERLIIPYTAVISFADPSVNFALQLKMMPLEDEDEHGEGADIEEFDASQLDELVAEAAAQAQDGDESEDEDGEAKTGEVITLDAFRKK